MRHTEQDRKDYQAYLKNRPALLANEVHAYQVKLWLAGDPSVGVLNSGKYYRIINGEAVYIKAFD